MAKIRMYALVNFKRKIVMQPDGDFYKELPRSNAQVACFPSEKAAMRFALSSKQPYAGNVKFEVLALDVGSKRGKPFPVRA